MIKKILTIYISTLLFSGCGQNGALYLSAPSEKPTTIHKHYQHVNAQKKFHSKLAATKPYSNQMKTL